jgi:hypothetical protein
MIMTRENQRAWRKTYPNATLSTTNPTWAAMGGNQDLNSEKPAINTCATAWLQENILHNLGI